MTGFMHFSGKIDSGLINYDRHLIGDIARAAVEEIDGVKLIPQNFADTAMELFGLRRCSGVEIRVDHAANAVALEVKVLVRYGLHIPETARHVQEMVREKFEQLTDIDLREVNVNVKGIEKGAAV